MEQYVSDLETGDVLDEQYDNEKHEENPEQEGSSHRIIRKTSIAENQRVRNLLSIPRF